MNAPQELSLPSQPASGLILCKGLKFWISPPRKCFNTYQGGFKGGLMVPAVSPSRVSQHNLQC